MTLPLPRARLAGCSCRSPLAHFFIHHGDSSLRELHPFTTITHLDSQNSVTPSSDDDFPIKFLFRKRTRLLALPKETEATSHLFSFLKYFHTKAQRLQRTQWTERLANLVDKKTAEQQYLQAQTAGASTDIKPGIIAHDYPVVPVSLRLEGPYFSPADPSRYETVVCFVAGSGISGAIAIAGAFAHHRSMSELITASENNDNFDLSKDSRPSTSRSLRWKRCIIIWSVREEDVIDIRIDRCLEAGVELQTHLTGSGRKRMNATERLETIRSEDPQGTSTWVYISGPKPFIQSAEQACKAADKVDYYAASWEI